MQRFFQSFDVRLRDFSAAIEVRGVSADNRQAVQAELDAMAEDIGRHREVNKDLATTWARCVVVASLLLLLLLLYKRK
jgi:hypothetical protein